MSDTAQIAIKTPPNITDKPTVPTGIELLKERLKTGLSYAKLGEKYGCSHVNIIQKIQTVIAAFSEDQHEQYLKNNVEYLKLIESLHMVESCNPDKTKKMSGLQHAIAGKIAHQMIQEKESGLASTNSLQSLINQATTVNIYVNQPEKCKDNPSNSSDTLTIDCKPVKDND